MFGLAGAYRAGIQGDNLEGDSTLVFVSMILDIGKEGEACIMQMTP